MGSDLELVGEHEKVQKKFSLSRAQSWEERRSGEKDEVASACITDPAALCAECWTLS